MYRLAFPWLLAAILLAANAYAPAAAVDAPRPARLGYLKRTQSGRR
jgi:hypothetical protein